MERTGETERKHRRRIPWGTSFFLSGVLLQLGARLVPGFGEWYAVRIYPALVGSIGRISGLFPFSVSEIGIYTGLLGAAFWGVRNRHSWRRLFKALYTALALIFLLYTAGCGVNYYRLPFSAYSGLKIEERSLGELEELVKWLTVQVNAASKLRWDADGNERAVGKTNVESVKAMTRLGETYSQLGGFYPKAKPVWISRILTVQQITGIYTPFTIEANYNREIVDYNIPHTVCHELSHLKGFMREDEANFIGYLACIGSEDIRFQYSGYLCGWIYAANALYKEDREAYFEYLEELDGVVREELERNTLFWDRFETRISEAANQINDAYLKINSQSDGVKSYGRVVDLMLAYHLSREGG